MQPSLDAQGVQHATFSQVRTNYDRSLEYPPLLDKLDPGAPRPSRVTAVARTVRFILHNLALMARNRWHSFGYACVNFGAPISAREFMLQRGLDFRRMTRDERAPHMEALGRTLMRAVGAVIPVLPVPVLATVLLRNAGCPLTSMELKSQVQSLFSELEASGAHVYIPRRDREYAVEVGLRMLRLRHLVDENEGFLQARPTELPLLRYYANSIAHLLAGSASSSRPIQVVLASPK